MSGRENINGNGLKGTTEVMKPVTTDASAGAKNYSIHNTQKKGTRKEKKETKERLTKVDETQSVSSPSGRKSPTPVMPSKQQNPRKQQPKQDVEPETDSQSKVQVVDPNKKFFVLGSALIAFGMILFVCIAAFGFPYFYNQGATTANQLNSAKQSTYSDTSSSDNKTETKTETAAEETCQHEWEEVRTTIHHDAVTHNVDHDAEYRTVTRYHTVCNICDAQIDNQIAEHKAETGHYSWSTNVPFEEQELVKEAYTQTVTDQEAFDEQIVMGRKCKKCGKAELYE